MSDPELCEGGQSGTLAAYDPVIDKALSLEKNLCPVTIFQVLRAEYLPDSIVIAGSCFSAVTLVALAKSVDKTTTGMDFILEDGTGRIRAEKTFDPKALRQLIGEINNWEATHYKAFESTYVEVTGTPKMGKSNFLRMRLHSVRPASYIQVLHHTLNVIRTNMLLQRLGPAETCRSDRNAEPSEVTMDTVDDIVQPASATVDRDPGPPGDRGESGTQLHVVPPCRDVLPNTFSPRRHQPYATLNPLERAVMKYMRRHQDRSILTTELARATQASYGCTQRDVDLAIQSLLSEAYITSPLDDGYVVITPRH